jgi:hypothetical protein
LEEITMRRKWFVRTTAALAAATAITFASPALANAEPQPLVPPVVPVVGIADGIGYSVQVVGNSVTYTATNVPFSGSIFGVPIPGTCSTAVIDAIKAAPILGPALIQIILGGQVPIQQVIGVIQQLIASDAVVAADPIRIANNAKVATHTFNNIPNGVYVVMTVCSVLTAPAYGMTGAFVLGPSLQSGSNEDGGSSISPR